MTPEGMEHGLLAPGPLCDPEPAAIGAIVSKDLAAAFFCGRDWIGAARAREQSDKLMWVRLGYRVAPTLDKAR